MAAQVLLILVGIVFLITGFIKVIYSRPFIIHVRHLGILPRPLTEIAASLFIQLECSVGTALVLFAFPVELIPAVMFMILVLSGITVWGVATRRVEDCGCYGGWLNLDIKQSLGLNLVYLVMLVGAWTSVDQDPPIAMWKVLAIIGVMALSNFLVRGSANSPLIDLSPLKPGRRWKQRWVESLDPATAAGNASFVVFMTQSCYRCKEWNEYIVNLAENPELPEPVLIFPEGGKEIEPLHGSIAHHIIKVGLFRFLVYQTPTAVLVRDGRIEARWVGHFPDEFI